MTNSISQRQEKLYEKLISALPDIKHENNNDIFSGKKYDLWFFKTENKSKYIYNFGLNKYDLKSPLMIINIDKNFSLSDDSLCWLIENEKGIDFCLNLRLLNKKYPKIDISEFEICEYQNKKYIVIDKIESENFIKNLELFVVKIKDTKKNYITNKNSKNHNKCEICNNNINKNYSSEIRKIYEIKPDLCGKCIEKIMACEFLKKADLILQNNETKTLNISREKFSNDREFDYGISLLEKLKILRYIGVKKLFYTINKNNPILNEYNNYINENNYLIDSLFSNPYESFKDKEKKMNLFINALQAGKSHNKAYKISKLSKKDVENFYKLGKNGDENYKDFYEIYDKLKIPTIDMSEFIKNLKKERDVEKALKKTKLKLETVEKWYELGKNNNDDYIPFYKQCNILLPEGFTQKSDDELINEFINLKKAGKTNKQAIEELKISNSKVKQWVNKGNLGNEKYVDFYNEYSSKKEKSLCKLCGRKINRKNTKGICKRCEKKQYAGNIVLKLLKHFSTDETFKKEDLKALDLDEMQITEYIWTLNEFNLITEKNSRYQLKSKNDLKDFLESCGLEIDEISKIDNKKQLYRTCEKCGKSLPIKSNFKNNDTVCQKCKKQINTAKYLTELLKYVEFDSEFSEDNLKQYYDDPFKLQAKLWALADNDLIKKNFDNNTYILSDKKTVTEFIDKYGESSSRQKTENKNVSDEMIEENSIEINEDGILVQIPDDLEKKLKKHSRSNKTGFAWVNKVGNNYIYARTVNGNRTELKDKNIRRLYEKVKEENMIWGVRNIRKAKETIEENDKINEAKEPVKENEKITETKEPVKTPKESNDDGMYKEIPKKYLNSFPSKPNKTGIAWVNQSGKAYTYTRTVNGEHVVFREKSIEELYEKVKSENLVWGIRDYDNASKFINFPPDFKIPENNTEKKTKIPKSKKSAKNKINSQLDKKYITDEVIENSPTGIAWVSKRNDRWIYNRQNDKQIIRLSDLNIENLYNKVIENNGIWGIIDKDKADKILNPKPDNHKVKTKSKNKTKNKIKITVTYFEKNRTRTEIVIKGRVKNTELISVFNDLKTFELNITRIITTTVNNNVDLFVELELPKGSMEFFERQIKPMGWDIII